MTRLTLVLNTCIKVKLVIILQEFVLDKFKLKKSEYRDFIASNE